MNNIQHISFLEVLKDVSAGNTKLLQKDFLASGKYPIIDQGQSLIAGYTDNIEFLCKAKPPVIIFGDHTRAVKYIDFPFVMGADGTKILIPKNGDDPKYLYYAIKAINLEGAGYSRHFKFLKEKAIFLPPLPEQKRIAAILDAADALRTQRRQSIAELDALLQSTFLEMFGDPVENPKGWNKNSLKRSNATVQIGPFGSLLHKEDYIDNGIPLINPKHINNGKILVNRSETISPKKALELITYQLEIGDVIMGRRGEMGRCAIVDSEHERMLCGTGSLFIRLSTDFLTPSYLEKLLSSPSMKILLEQLAWGVTMPNLNRTKIEELIIPMPPIDLQQKFAEIVETIEAQKTRLQAHLVELDTLFASLQQRAFNGEL